jgi:hypothetical protein
VAPGAPVPVDVSDRAARLLGRIYGDQGVLTQRAGTLDAYSQLRAAGVEYDARQIRLLTAADIVDVSDRAARLLGTVSPVAASVWDVSDRPARQLGVISGSITASSDVTDRWARQLGLIDLSRVLGAALSAANPVIAGIYDAAANRMPAMNAAATAGYVHLTDGTYTNEFDAVDGAQVSIDLAHHKVHEGEHYTVTDSATINSGAANRKVWRFTTPNTAVRMHFVLSFSSTLSGVLTWNENPTLNVAGTGLTIFNSDRNSLNTTTLTVFKDTTLTGDGSPLATVVIGTNAPATRIGGNTRINAETILKQNEDYVLMFTADLNATIIAMVVEFYEA